VGLKNDQAKIILEGQLSDSSANGGIISMNGVKVSVGIICRTYSYEHPIKINALLSNAFKVPAVLVSVLQCENVFTIDD
jgi:hypothetical protein